MARIRSIHPGLATDEAFMAMSPYAMASWPLLWMECDDHGVFEWKPLVLKARILPAAQCNFGDILAEWQQLGCVVSFEQDGRQYGAVKNFCKFQRPKKPAFKHPLPNRLRTFVHLTELSSKPVPDQLPTEPEKSQQMEDEGGRMDDVERKKTTRAKRAESDWPPDFGGQFWRLYPRKEAKGSAMKVLSKLRKSPQHPSWQALIAAIQRYSEAVAGKERQYIKLPATWLNAECWLDEMEPQAAPDVVSAIPRHGPLADGQFYAEADSEELDAWDRWSRENHGKNMPRDKRGGWVCPRQWPPDWEPSEAKEIPFREALRATP